jgi:DNA-binding transcriptional MerR regulator
MDKFKHGPVETGYLPIGTVSRLTGVNAVTLRAWERRYGLINPKRTPKGHRLYTPADIERVRELRRLVGQGVPISQIRVSPAPENEARAAVEPDLWADFLERMVAAISRFDEPKLEALYQDAMALYPVDVVTKQLLMPLLRVLGERWDRTAGGIAEEHFFGVFMRNKLGARFHHRQHHARGQCLLAACLPGEHHELGLLLLALAAHDRGYRVVLLGADMPLEQLPHVSQRRHIDAVVLSSSVEPAAASLERALPQLVATMGVPVYVGGNTSTRHRAAIERAGAHAVGEDLIAGIDLIGEALPGLKSAR